jgi:hypothetical protein
VDGLIVIRRKKQQIFGPQDHYRDRRDYLVGSDNQLPCYQLKRKDNVIGESNGSMGGPTVFWEGAMKKVKSVLSAETTAWVFLAIYIGVLCVTQMAITKEVRPKHDEQTR